jgi:uncharacterized membrane protein YbhN (UPF0104 family)
LLILSLIKEAIDTILDNAIEKHEKQLQKTAIVRESLVPHLVGFAFKATQSSVRQPLTLPVRKPSGFYGAPGLKFKRTDALACLLHALLSLICSVCRLQCSCWILGKTQNRHTSFFLILGI